MSALALLLIAAPAYPQATIDDFKTPPLRTNSSTIAEQWDNLILAIQSLGPDFLAQVKTGTDPIAVLNGMIFGKSGQSTLYKQWRIFADSSGDLALQVNTGTESVPVWTTRALFDDVLGLTSAPAAHTHTASDVVSGQFDSARISRASVEQWAVITPAASRIVQGNVSGQIESGWIPQTGVTQYQNSLQIDAGQVVTGQFADARVKLSNITQFGYLPTTGDVILRFSGSCPTGTTEYTPIRGIGVRGADTLAADVDVPDVPGRKCGPSTIDTGCGAPSGAANYNDTIGATTEMPSHAHTGPSHSHNTTLSDHNHTGPSHQHTMAHTHGYTTPNHSHTARISIDPSLDPGSGATCAMGDTEVLPGNCTAPQETEVDGSIAGNTTGASSAANTGLSGTGATGLSGGGTFGSSLAGTGNTGTAGGTDPFLGPFVTALFCVVN